MHGAPASHTWLDASGQYGPALIDGTDGDDVIIAADDLISDDVWAGQDFDICFFTGGDDIHAECEY